MRTAAADHLIRQAVLREHATSKADHTLVAFYVYYSAHTHSRLSILPCPCMLCFLGQTLLKPAQTTSKLELYTSRMWPDIAVCFRYYSSLPPSEVGRTCHPVALKISCCVTKLGFASNILTRSYLSSKREVRYPAQVSLEFYNFSILLTVKITVKSAPFWSMESSAAADYYQRRTAK